jgi:hypothetical protein
MIGMPGLIIQGVSDNFQRAFEDQDFCRTALNWCLLVVARIGVLQWPGEPDAFILRWTSLGETNASLSAALSLPEDGDSPSQS